MHNPTGMLQGPGEKVMVIVAHPDDAEFMCAGSICLLYTSDAADE